MVRSSTDWQEGGAGDPRSAGGAAPPPYRIIAELGHGGMARVYVAVAEGPAGFNKLFVTKELLSELADDPEMLAMFLDEARLAARLNHPNIVQTNHVGASAGRHFIAMEYLEGQPLHRILMRLARAGIALPLSARLRVVLDVLSGLHYAHELADYDGMPIGVVHRDISPHNVFVTYDGQVKILDFGIAKTLCSAHLTRTGMLKGKVAYMAPEQMLGEPVDRRSDLYSVGVMLWEAATGGRLWKGVPEAIILRKVMDDQIPRPSSVAPGVPPALERICMRALAFRQEDRFATAADLASALEPVLDALSPRVATKDLGRLVASSFHEDRARVRALIAQELGRAHDRPRDPLEPVQRIAFTETSTLPAPAAGWSPGEQDSATGVAKSNSLSPAVAAESLRPSPRRSRVTPLVVSIGVVLCATASFGAAKLAVWRRSANAATPPAPAVSARPASVRISITAQPSDATIFLDGKPLAGNPFEGDAARDGAPHEVRVEARGHQTHTTALGLERDVRLMIALTPLPLSNDASARAAASEQTAQPAVANRMAAERPRSPPGGPKGDGIYDHASAPVPTTTGAKSGGPIDLGF